MASKAFLLAPFFALLMGCADPAVAIEKFRAFEADTLSFLRDGQTTRPEILLKFGTPASKFEGDRILTYDFVRDQSGEWRRVGSTTTSDWRFYVLPGTCSLVLVFSPEGILAKHTLVKDREVPPPAPAPEQPDNP